MDNYPAAHDPNGRQFPPTGAAGRRGAASPLLPPVFYKTIMIPLLIIAAIASLALAGVILVNGYPWTLSVLLFGCSVLAGGQCTKFVREVSYDYRAVTLYVGRLELELQNLEARYNWEISNRILDANQDTPGSAAKILPFKLN